VEPQEDSGAVDISPEEADEVLSEGQTSLVMQLVKSGQLVIGLDLTKVVLPTFILEPRSLLEKLSDFWMHPQIFLELSDKTPIPGYNADVSRMIRVVKWYMSGWHVRPRGVKKPYNPILGEMFECDMTQSDKKVWYVAEQVSHHPPITAFYAQGGNVSMHGMYYPRSKFLGNSAASIGEGSSTILFDDGQVYHCTWPSVYVRGIVFGRLLMEIGGKVEIKCEQTNIQADIDFKVKGYFTGAYNSVVGGIFYTAKGYKQPEVILGGKWNEKVTFHPGNDKKNVQTLVDMKALAMGTRTAGTAVGIPPDKASRSVWAKVTAALAGNDVDQATKEKNAVEEAQRDARKGHEANGTEHVLTLFRDISCRSGARTYNHLQYIYTGPGVAPHPHIEKLLAAAQAPDNEVEK
jgi:hypothetical protein